MREAVDAAWRAESRRVLATLMHEMFRAMPPPGAFEEAAKAVPPIHELCPGAHAYQMVRGLGLAHMDAALKANEGAAQLLRADLKALLAARGVDVSVH